LVLMGIILGFSVFEELYKWYLFKRHMALVIYSMGTIFFLLNVVYFYVIDYMMFDFSWFISAYHPIIFVIVYGVIRYGIKDLYKRLERLIYHR